MAQVVDVAEYILEKIGQTTTMKLQKLCYYSQGWSLAWDEVPLFPNEIEAWANGPVVRDLYRAHKGRFKVKSLGGRSRRLSRTEKETIDAVLDAYGSLSGQQLSELSHSERPWLEARGTTSEGARSEARISLTTMQDFFGGLDAADRNQR